MNLDIFSLKIVIYLTYLYLPKHIMINCLLHRVHTPSTFMSVPCFVSVYAIDYFLTRLLVTLLFITSQYSGTPPWTLHWTNRRGLDWKTLKTFQSSDKMKSKSCQLHHSAKCDWNIVLAWKLLLFLITHRKNIADIQNDVEYIEWKPRKCKYDDNGDQQCMSSGLFFDLFTESVFLHL